MNKKVGTVIRWLDRGFGFIASEGSTDIFCHWSDIEMEGFKELEEGQIVEYVPVFNELKNKMEATEVKVVEEGDQCG